jgi:hypothetical protein
MRCGSKGDFVTLTSLGKENFLTEAFVMRPCTFQRPWRGILRVGTGVAKGELRECEHSGTEEKRIYLLTGKHSNLK